ncbi:hypothetical protein [Cohaesibacter gelatinilyticus]|uniref:Uncharacterized protein n=1 Tax=Cohaesibacter gelatinilyticus TaxID=372072 RepID=A0A285NI90_9HYPH|nr:hypothetical protein [Cohaesibacter gelatinilyticus]SNZ09232.1 hypothetical protein SAMN06265368_1971 [Cohaesibacter gelatinilyticus]HAT87495.1 hypothetical protein [Hyphomicrobiales bacterium]
MKSTYVYKLNGPATSAVTLFILIFSGLMVFLAFLEPDKFIGIQIGLPFGAMAYGALAAGALFLSIRLVWIWSNQRNSTRAISLQAEVITLPKSVTSNREITIPYSNITKLNYLKIARTSLNVIQIHHDKGITQISDLGFSTQDEFSEIYDNLRQKISKSL